MNKTELEIKNIPISSIKPNPYTTNEEDFNKSSWKEFKINS